MGTKAKTFNLLPRQAHPRAKDTYRLKGLTYELLSKLANDYTSGKTAEDYFKELNFTKKVHENFNSIIYYSNTNEWLAIAFYLDTHEVKLIDNEDKYITIDPDLNKAIQMQILELGWK